jgi:hypothetical protein
MYNDRDLYARAMQPHKDLLHQAEQEREVRQVLDAQNGTPYYQRLMAALNKGLNSAVIHSRPQNRVQRRKTTNTNYRMRRFS